MGMEHTHKKQFIDKEMYQSHHMVVTSLVKHTIRPPPFPNIKNLFKPPALPPLTLSQ